MSRATYGDAIRAGTAPVSALERLAFQLRHRGFAAAVNTAGTGVLVEDAKDLSPSLLEACSYVLGREIVQVDATGGWRLLTLGAERSK